MSSDPPVPVPRGKKRLSGSYRDSEPKTPQKGLAEAPDAEVCFTMFSSSLVIQELSFT